MTLRLFVLMILVVGASGAASAQDGAAPVGDPKAGAVGYRKCTNCHGEDGAGGYGPDLAEARGLTWQQFRKPVRQPWGVMPYFTEMQLPDQMLADIYAFLKTTKPVAQPLGWHWIAAPASAPLGQRLYMQGYGCGQCHEPENKWGRMWLGEWAKDVNFDSFAKQIYEHYVKFPKGNMPSYSRDRLPEATLREIYKWMVEDLGLRPSIGGAIAIGTRGESSTQYNLTITNRGKEDKGIAAERLTVFVRIPVGTKLSGGTGPGYQGSMPLTTLGLEPAIQFAPHPKDAEGTVERPKQNLSGDVVVWKIPRIVSGEKVALSFTLDGPSPTAEQVKGFEGSTVYWETPGRRPAGSPPVMVYRDLRAPDKGDHERIPPPMFTN